MSIIMITVLKFAVRAVLFTSTNTQPILPGVKIVDNVDSEM